MRTTALAVIAAATLVTAQLGSIPSCEYLDVQDYSQEQN